MKLFRAAARSILLPFALAATFLSKEADAQVLFPLPVNQDSLFLQPYLQKPKIDTNDLADIAAHFAQQRQEKLGRLFFEGDPELEKLKKDCYEPCWEDFIVTDPKAEIPSFKFLNFKRCAAEFFYSEKKYMRLQTQDDASPIDISLLLDSTGVERLITEHDAIAKKLGLNDVSLFVFSTSNTNAHAFPNASFTGLKNDAAADKSCIALTIGKLNTPLRAIRHTLGHEDGHLMLLQNPRLLRYKPHSNASLDPATNYLHAIETFCDSTGLTAIDYDIAAPFIAFVTHELPFELLQGKADLRAKISDVFAEQNEDYIVHRTKDAKYSEPRTHPKPAKRLGDALRQYKHRDETRFRRFAFLLR